MKARLRLALILPAALLAAELCYRGGLSLRGWREADRGVFRLYAIGGSTTSGQPFAFRYSFPKEVEEMFAGELQGRRIALENLSLPGESIVLQWRKLRRAIAGRKGPGAVLIYAGVEPAGPFPDDWTTGLAHRLGERLERWAVARSFVLAELLRLLPRNAAYSMSDYAFYLRQTAAVARANGLIPVFSTVVSNLADMEPSFGAEEWTDPEEPVVAVGRRLERLGRWKEAVSHYDRASSRSPFAAYLVYRQAKCWQALGRYERARDGYWRAVEAGNQTRFPRATRGGNELVRRVAAETGSVLADTAALFEQRAPHGLLGRELFMDFHHPNLRGYHLIAWSFAQALGSSLGARPRGADWDEAELRRRFSLGDEEMGRAWLDTGTLLLQCACALYPWPDDRLALTRRAFAAAVRARPGDARGRYGKALLESPSGRRLLRDRTAMTEFVRRVYASPPPGR